jgi:hypothetical protein
MTRHTSNSDKKLGITPGYISSGKSIKFSVQKRGLASSSSYVIRVFQPKGFTSEKILFQ